MEVILILDRLARLRTEQDRPADAAELHARAESRMAAARHLVTDGDRIDVGYGGPVR